MVSDLVVVTTDNVHYYYKVEWVIESNTLAVMEGSRTIFYPLNNIVSYTYPRVDDVSLG